MILISGKIKLILINDDNLSEVREMFTGFPDSDYMLTELNRSYIPQFDQSGKRKKYGFYTLYNNDLAGLSLLGVSSWKDFRGYTGADILKNMRGKGIAPLSKSLLFYLAFEKLGLNRVETGCFVSNAASRRSIEKTAGFQLEGTLREYAKNSKGEFEDEYRYAILRSDWEKLYDKSEVQIIE